MENEPGTSTPEPTEGSEGSNPSETMELTEPVEPIAPPVVPPPAPAAPVKSSGAKGVLIGVAIFLALALIAGQAFVIVSLTSTKDDIAALESQVADVSQSVDDVNSAVNTLSEDVAAVSQSASTPPGNVTPAPAVPAGFLPRFESGTQDAALGMTMSTVSATEAYSQEAMTIDPADGTKRVWLIWAHWCPYCQQELPDLAEWWPENKDRFPGSDLMTVTTSMDPARGNPLDQYLATEQFPFPVLVDEDSQIAAQFGVSAFPFWVVTNGDGSVLYRTAGLIGPEAVEQLFTQLEEYNG